MTKSRRAAMLWFLGGGALLAAGLIETPHRLLSIAAGILYFAVGIVWFTRSRRNGETSARGCRQVTGDGRPGR